MKPLLLDNRRVDLWHVRLDELTDAALLKEYCRLLSPEEDARYRRFTHQGAQLQFLAGRALVRTILAQYTEIEPRLLDFVCNRYGKPALVAPTGTELEFNLSHTEGLAICAVSRGSVVGVDVEKTSRPGECLHLAERYFAPAEVAALTEIPYDRKRETFFEFWTLKEAFIKARGTGLSTPLDGFAFSLAPDRPPTISFPGLTGETPGAWQFASFPIAPDYRVAVAIRRPSPPAVDIVTREIIPLRN